MAIGKCPITNGCDILADGDTNESFAVGQITANCRDVMDFAVAIGHLVSNDDHASSRGIGTVSINPHKSGIASSTAIAILKSVAISICYHHILSLYHNWQTKSNEKA